MLNVINRLRAAYLLSICFSFCFQGGKVPVDGLRIQEEFEGVHSALLWFVFAVSSLGILMAIGFLTFNVYNQNIR